MFKLGKVISAILNGVMSLFGMGHKVPKETGKQPTFLKCKCGGVHGPLMSVGGSYYCRKCLPPQFVEYFRKMPRRQRRLADKQIGKYLKAVDQNG